MFTKVCLTVVEWAMATIALCFLLLALIEDASFLVAAALAVAGAAATRGLAMLRAVNDRADALGLARPQSGGR